MTRFTIRQDDLTDGAIVALLQAHRRQMQRYSPEQSIHALDEAALFSPSLTFWSARADTLLAGCVALKALSADSGEIKSMKTAEPYLRQGVAQQLLHTAIVEARRRHYRCVYLETGTHAAFLPAIRLYTRGKFIPCPPFADYVEDQFSAFYQLTLDDQ